MAVPGRRNGLLEEDDDGFIDENAVFEEDAVDADLDFELPVHLRDFSTAAQIGDVDALRLAIGRPHFSFYSSTSLVLLVFVFFLVLTHLLNCLNYSIIVVVSVPSHILHFLFEGETLGFYPIFHGFLFPLLCGMDDTFCFLKH